MMKLRNIFLPVVAASLLGACASPNDYSKTISGLKTSLSSAEESLVEIDQKMTADAKVLLDSGLKNRQARLKTQTDNDCTSKGNSCRIVVSCSVPQLPEGAGNKDFDCEEFSGEPYPLVSFIPKTRAAFQVIGKYVLSLEKIIEADSAGKASESASKAIADIGEIEKLAVKQEWMKEATTFTPYVKPTQDLVSWLIEQYVEEVKVDALKRAVTDAHPAIMTIAGQADFIDEMQRHYVKSAVGDVYQNAYDCYQHEFNGMLDDECKHKVQKTVDPSALKAIEKQSNAYHAILSVEDINTDGDVSRLSVFTKFASAHEKLVNELNGSDDVSLKDVLESVERLKDDAKKLKELVEAFDSVRKKAAAPGQ